MNKKQYEAMRKKLMDEAQALINEGDAESAQAKMDEVAALDAKWDAIAQAAANFNALNKEPEFAAAVIPVNDKTGGEPEKESVLDVWASENYLKAWANGQYPDVEYESLTIGADGSVTITMHVLTKTERQIRELQASQAEFEVSQAEQDEAIAEMLYGGGEK